MDPISSAILAYLENLAGQEASKAQQATLNTTLDAVNAVLVLVRTILADIADGTTGLAAIQAELATFQAATALHLTAIDVAIAAVQQGGSPVTLPTTPPSAYIAPDSGEVAGVVWGFEMESAGGTAQHFLSQAWYLLSQVDQMGGTPNGYSPWLRMSGLASQYPFSLFNTDTPQPSVANILPTDTLVGWLTRELPDWTVSAGDEGPDSVEIRKADFSTEFLWQGGVALFNLLKNAVNPLAPSALPPVWPGLASVTLGTPQDLANGVTVPGPLDGVLVSITSVPTSTGKFDFDGDVSWRNVGGITFQSDNGQNELPQTLGFGDALYCPRQMTTAALAKLRTPGAIVGTVTPFLRA